MTDSSGDDPNHAFSYSIDGNKCYLNYIDPGLEIRATFSLENSGLSQSESYVGEETHKALS